VKVGQLVKKELAGETKAFKENPSQCNFIRHDSDMI
jgi:hypothetical protein